MARLLTAGAEWNDVQSEGLASAAFTTSPVRTGTYAFTISTALQFNISGVLGTTYFFRAYAYWDGTLPALRSPLIGCRDVGGNFLGAISLETDGTVTLGYGGLGVTTLVGSATSIPTNTWTRLELKVLIASGAADAVDGRVEGVSFASGSSLSISDSVVTNARGGGNISGHLFYDDLAINDDTGANQNTWPGSGNVVLLKPASDSAVGSGWTDSGGAGSGLSASVDNTPPTGIADTTSNAGHQIRNASSAAASYDANLETYDSHGIVATDIINVLVPQCNTAAPVSTGAKTGSVGVVSNPTIANIAFVNGASVAANFWQGNAAGTYTTGWKWEKGTVTYGSAVTVGTAPVMRVTITGGTASRIAMCDAIGLYVDYTPVPVMPPQQPTRFITF